MTISFIYPYIRHQGWKKHYTDYTKRSRGNTETSRGKSGCWAKYHCNNPLVICVRRKWWYLVVSQNLLKRVFWGLEVYSALQTLKTLVKEYYNKEIVPALFEYEFLLSKKRRRYSFFFYAFSWYARALFGFEHFPFLGYSVRPVQVGTKHHEAKGHYENKWVQDKAAWTETKTVGWKCSCGAKK